MALARKKKLVKRYNPNKPKRNPDQTFLEESGRLVGWIRFKLNQYDFFEYNLESEEVKKIILSNLIHIQTITSDLTRKWKP